MARQPFGGTGADLVYNPGTAAGDPISNAIGLNFRIYADDAGVELADIQTLDGITISGSVITVDSTSQLPGFLGPDTDPETFELWCRAQAGGPLFRLYRNGGLPGVPGEPGQPPSDAAIQAAVQAYMAGQTGITASTIPVTATTDNGLQGPNVQSALEGIKAEQATPTSVLIA